MSALSPQTSPAGGAMTSPRPAGDPATDRFEAEMNSGAPNLDNVTDPDVIGHYGLEWDRCPGCGTAIPGDVDQCDDCGGQCTECGREVSQPGLCFDCDVEASYVGGLAPRFGAQP